MTPSALTAQSEPAAAVWTVTGAAVASVLTYGAVGLWWGGPGTLLATGNDSPIWPR